jgi:hypothetical protein
MTQDSEPSIPEMPAEQLTPEAQARVERLIRDLEEAPAIACPITFNWRGNQELADVASIRIRLYGLMMREKWPSMA